MKKCKNCKEEFFPPKYDFNRKYCYKDECKVIHKPKKSIKKVSDKRQVENKMYMEVRAEYMKDNPVCEICGSRQVELHHKKGRIGKLLFDIRYFMTVCREDHRYIHENPKEARKKGWLL